MPWPTFGSAPWDDQVEEEVAAEIEEALGDVPTGGEPTLIDGILDPVFARIALGLKDAATRDTGNDPGTVAAGDDPKLLDAMQRGANGSDIPDPEAFRAAISVDSSTEVDGKIEDSIEAIPGGGTTTVNGHAGPDITLDAGDVGAEEIGVAAGLIDVEAARAEEAESDLATALTSGLAHISTTQIDSGVLDPARAPTLDAIRDPVASVDFAGQRGVSGADPINPQDFTTKAWVIALRDALVNGAPGLLDTLGEIAAQMATDESAAAALLSAITTEASTRGAADAVLTAALGPGRVTFNANAGFTMASTDRQVVNTTALTADRSQPLIAAGSMPAGTRVLLKDEAGVYPHVLTWTPHAGDTIANDANRSLGSLIMRDSGAVFEVETDGSATWRVIMHGLQRPVLFGEHPHPVAIPRSAVAAHDTGALWVPVPWNTAVVDTSSVLPGLGALATTIDTPSNGHTLPQGTIDIVANAATALPYVPGVTLPLVGYAVITHGGVDYIVGYLNRTTTQLQFCNTASTPNGSGIRTPIAQAGISAGVTIATGDVVKGASCIFSPRTPYLWAMTAQIGWAKSDTGSRYVRVRDVASGLVISEGGGFAADFEKQPIQMTSQPGYNPDGSNDCVIEVFQDSLGTTNVVTDALQSPLLMMFLAGGA